MKENYEIKMNQIIENLPADGKPSLLLHSCCGPCSSAVLERLCPHFNVTLFFYNPNIMPGEEYQKRLQAQRKVIDILPFSINIIESTYDTTEFLNLAKGLEKEPEGGNRCKKCIAMRLKESAKYASQNHFNFFCSTLSVSPHKDVYFINQVGEKLSKEYTVTFLPSDFKKKNGFLRSTEFCRDHNIYRQNYCGCIFSKTDKSVVSST